MAVHIYCIISIYSVSDPMCLKWLILNWERRLVLLNYNNYSSHNIRLLFERFVVWTIAVLLSTKLYVNSVTKFIISRWNEKFIIVQIISDIQPKILLNTEGPGCLSATYCKFQSKNTHIIIHNILHYSMVLQITIFWKEISLYKKENI